MGVGCWVLGEGGVGCWVSFVRCHFIRCIIAVWLRHTHYRCRGVRSTAHYVCRRRSKMPPFSLCFGLCLRACARVRTFTCTVVYRAPYRPTRNAVSFVRCHFIRCIIAVWLRHTHYRCRGVRSTAHYVCRRRSKMPPFSLCFGLCLRACVRVRTFTGTVVYRAPYWPTRNAVSFVRCKKDYTPPPPK